jgi:predicted RNA-binding protein with PIN domain
MSASDGSDDGIPDRLVSSALEFAVGIAAASVRIKPALPFPAELKPFLKFQKLPPKALADVRRAIERDGLFFERIASRATPELLDEAGLLWLTRPEGWHERLAELAAVDDSVDAMAELRRAERRREAAEQLAQRSVAEVAGLRLDLDRQAAELQRLTADVAQLRVDRSTLEADLASSRLEVRHAQDRVAAASERAERFRLEAADAELRAADASRVRDDVLAQRAGWTARRASDESILAGAALLAADLDEQVAVASQLARVLGKLSDELSALEPAARRTDPTGGRPGRRPVGTERRGGARRPIALPGGIYGSSGAASEHFVRTQGVAVLIDGYNVAKLGWPKLDLEQQRGQCIDAAEDVARRYGTNIAVVFDGTLIPGAAAPGRRLVRVQFSAEGVSADDVLRAEVSALPADVPVVVVTNDQAVATDVRMHGANTMTSEQWLELARR